MMWVSVCTRPNVLCQRQNPATTTFLHRNEIHIGTFGVWPSRSSWGTGAFFKYGLSNLYHTAKLQMVGYFLVTVPTFCQPSKVIWKRTKIAEITELRPTILSASSKTHHVGREGGREKVTICCRETTTYFSFAIDRATWCNKKVSLKLDSRVDSSCFCPVHGPSHVSP